MSKSYSLLIDLRNCVGCHACTVACKQENDMHLKSIWNKVETVGPVGIFPDLKMYYMLKLCMQCAEPACAEPCVSRAITRQEDGLVAINPEKCDGCEACIPACPYNVMSFNPETGRPEKCHLCMHRVKDGLIPACVSPCVGQAIIFGDANDPESELSQVAKAAGDDVFVLNPEYETNPSVRFIKPQKWFDPKTGV